MLQITNKGLVIDRLEEIHERLTTGFKSIYGDEINLDIDTPDGQMISLFSQAMADVNEVIAFIYQMLDPYRATGDWLDQRALYAGVVRRSAEYSYMDNVIITGRAGTLIQANTILTDKNGDKWLTLDDVTLNELGSAKVGLRSTELGVFSLGAGETLNMETVTVGVDAITTTEKAKEGVEEETDGELLKRFMFSHAINNFDDKSGIQAALLSLPDVKQAKVIENYTDELDVKTGVPAHSMNAIVIGGDDQQIAETIIKKKMGGCNVVGEIEKSVLIAGHERYVRFDRAKPIDVHIKILAERIDNYIDIDVNSIEDSLMSAKFDIGESVYAMRLICYANAVNGFNIKSILVNDKDKVEIGVRQIAQIKKVEVLIE